MSKKKKSEKSRIKNREVAIFMLPGAEKRIDPSPLEAYPEHAKYIAYIIAEWSQIELRLAMWVATRMLADQHIVLPMIYALETSRARLDVMAAALRGLIGVERPIALGKLDKLLSEASQLLTLRVRYAHGHFGPDRDSLELAIAPLWGSKRKPINIPLHELKYHFERFKKLSHDLAVIVAAELGLPLRGPDAPDSVPAHPLGLVAAHARQKQKEPPPPSPESPAPDVDQS